jgi:hypothetical protein
VTPESGWRNTASGFWNNPANWNPTGVPGPSSQAVINVPGNYAVFSDQNETVGSLSIGDPKAILEIFPGTEFTLNAATQSQNGGTILLDPGSQFNVKGTLVNTGGITLADATISGGVLQNAAGGFIEGLGSIGTASVPVN